MFDRINIIQLFKLHFATLYDYGAKSWSGKHIMPWQDLMVFVVLPLTIALTTQLLQLRIDEFYLNVIITSLSIFVGLLFSFLTLVYEMAAKEKDKQNQPNVKVTANQIAKYTLVKELFTNIAFAIALSIISIVAVLLTVFKPAIIVERLKPLRYFDQIRASYIYATNALAIALVVLFILTLLMILKRFFLIFKKEIE